MRRFLAVSASLAAVACGSLGRPHRALNTALEDAVALGMETGHWRRGVVALGPTERDAVAGFGRRAGQVLADLRAAAADADRPELAEVDAALVALAELASGEPPAGEPVDRLVDRVAALGERVQSTVQQYRSR